MSKLYFIGIQGVGMSALALVAKGLGYEVSGSDAADTYGKTGELLKAAGITCYSGFDAARIKPEIGETIIGAAFGADNPEVAAVINQGLPHSGYSSFLNQVSREKKTVVVTGTHGKTTTTALTAFIVQKAGLDPSWIIGTTDIGGLEAHGHAGAGDYFIIEGDEYKRAADDPTPKFLDLAPYAVILNNIEHDHPDVYPTLESLIEAFRKLIAIVPDDGFLVVNGDDPNISRLRSEISDKHFITYGFGADNEYVIEAAGAGVFTVTPRGQSPIEMQLAIHGKHNFMNATAASVTANRLGVDWSQIAAILPEFTAVEHRYQKIGEYNGAIIIDDFAHHPTAIRTTLETARADYPDRRLWALFQPHTYSRLRALLPEFATSFAAADFVIVTDIFASARETEITVTSQDLIDKIKEAGQPNVIYVTKISILSYCRQYLTSNDVLVSLSAGDVPAILKRLVEAGSQL